MVDVIQGCSQKLFEGGEVGGGLDFSHTNFTLEWESSTRREGFGAKTSTYLQNPPKN